MIDNVSILTVSGWIPLYHPIILNGMCYVAHLMTFWKITIRISHFYKLNFLETLKVKCECQNVIDTSNYTQAKAQ